MIAEQYLLQIKKLDFMIENKVRDHRRWVEVAEGLGGCSAGDKVQTSRNLHQIPDAIGRYIDIERDIAELRRQRAEIIRTIECLPPTEYDLIYRLYVQEQSMKEIAYHFGKSYGWAKARKRAALGLVQTMLDERSE